MIDLDKDKGQSSDPIKGIENTKTTPRDSSESINTSKKPGAGGGGGPEININVTPDGFELEGDVGIGGSVGIATVVAEADGSVGITAKIPIPAVPGLTANGGIVINVLTGEIESVSGGASLYIFEVSVTIVGCDIITTFSVKIPNTNIGFSYDIYTELPNCKEPEEELPPEEPTDPQEAPFEEAPPVPEPYDPPIPAPSDTGNEWHLVTFGVDESITYTEYCNETNGQLFCSKSWSFTPRVKRSYTHAYIGENKLWIKAPLNLEKTVQIEGSKFTTRPYRHTAYHRLFIHCSGVASVGPQNERINETSFTYQRFVPYDKSGLVDGFSYGQIFESQIFRKSVDPETAIITEQRLQTVKGHLHWTINGKKDEKPPIKIPPPPPPPPPPRIEMDNCCAALLRMTRELHEFVKPQDLKNSKLPKRLIYPDGKGEEKVTCLGDFIRYLILEIDAKGFQPFSLEVRDTNAAQEGNQPLSITAYSLSAALKEILQYLIDTESDGDNANNMLVRLAYECSLIHKIAAVTQQQVDNIENFLDYEVRQEQVNLPMMFNMLAGVANKKKKGIDANDEVNTEAVMSELLQQVEHPIVVTKNVSRKQLTEALLELKQTMLTGGRDF